LSHRAFIAKSVRRSCNCGCKYTIVFDFYNYFLKK
jgi:hypothetical protein